MNVERNDDLSDLGEISNQQWTLPVGVEAVLFGRIDWILLYSLTCLEYDRALGLLGVMLQSWYYYHSSVLIRHEKHLFRNSNVATWVFCASFLFHKVRTRPVSVENSNFQHLLKGICRNSWLPTAHSIKIKRKWYKIDAN